MGAFGDEAIHRDAIAIMEDEPIEFTWGGNDYLGAIGPLATRNPNVQGGFLPDYDLSIVTTPKKLNAGSELVDRFPDNTLPTEGDKITIDDVTYRIDRVVKDQWGSMVQFDLLNDDAHATG